MTVAIPPATPVLDPHPTMTNQASLLITGCAADGATIEISGLTGVVTVPINAGAFTADVSLQHSLLVQSIVVRMTHADTTPFADKIVTFDVTRSDGRLTSDGVGDGTMMLQVRTDANGEARAFWRLGSDAGCGNNRVAATSRDIAGTTFFCATATPAPAAQINIGSGNTQRAEAGGPAPEPLQAGVHDGRNAAAGIPVTFTVITGGGSVNGLGVITIDTDITGHAEVRFTLGPDGGNHVVEADFPGNPGLPATFITFGLSREIAAPTSFVGLVLDNASRPIEGATCSLVVGNDPPLIVTSDVSGQFRFDDIPGAGAARLVIDGLTATGLNGRAIPVGSFPSLNFEPIVVPNAANSLPMPVALPPLNPNNARVFDNTQDVS